MNNTISTITVLTTTNRGAKLITDGTKAVWVMGRQVREDGSLTAGAREALEASTMTDAEARLLVAARAGEAAAREELAAKRREENKAKANADVTINVRKENFRGERGAAWQVKTSTQMRGRYGNYYNVCAFLPKSKVTVVPQADGSVNITMPAWLMWNNNSMICTEVA